MRVVPGNALRRTSLVDYTEAAQRHKHVTLEKRHCIRHLNL